jgi:hypothetical protein
MAEGQISISGALSFAWSLLSQHWRAIWGVLALNALSWTVLFAGLFANRPELVTAGSTALLVTKYPLYGAIFRLGAGHEGGDNPDFKLGALGIQWRPMEFRIFIADLLLSILLFVVVLLVMVAMSAILVGVIMSQGGVPAQIVKDTDVMRVLGPHGREIVMLEQAVVLLVAMFVTTRLLLAWPASALGGKIAVLRTWRLTRGAFWRILVSYVVVQAPMAFTFGMAAVALNGELAAFTPAQTFGFALLSGILAGAASTPLNAGLQVYFYKALGPVPEPGPSGSTGRS